jgi:hypothetical protein
MGLQGKLDTDHAQGVQVASGTPGSPLAFGKSLVLLGLEHHLSGLGPKHVKGLVSGHG